MMANNRYKLENMLISSRAHFRSVELKAYIKATKDLHFKGDHNDYSNYSMTRMQGSRYLMRVLNNRCCIAQTYIAYVDTMIAERLKLDIHDDTSSCFVDGRYMLVVKNDMPIAILRDLQEIGEIEFDVNLEGCKNGHYLHGRYEQQAGHSVYAVDNEAHLYRIEWQDIKDGKYCKTLVKSNVKHFYVDGGLGLATLTLDDTLSLATGIQVDLRAKVDSEASWTIVTSIAKCWIACGDRVIEGHAIMASVNRQGKAKKPLKLKLTSNGYVRKDGNKFAGIYSLHQVYVRGRRGIMLTIERDGGCHLISVTYGRLSKLQSVDSIVNVDRNENKSEWIVTSVTATGSESEFIVGGYGWTKRISLKLK